MHYIEIFKRIVYHKILTVKNTDEFDNLFVKLFTLQNVALLY